MALLVALAALMVAFVALVLVRRQARQVRQVTEMYWQLKYDHGELKAAVLPSPDAPQPSTTAFVPLTAVKRPSS